MLYSQRLLLLSIVVVLCAACADATARERCLRLLALSFRVNSRSTCCCVFQLRAGWCSCHVALLALSRDAAAASQLAVHYDLPSRCLFVSALLLVDVTRLRQVVLIGCLFCASALPSFEVSGCLVRFMSISYFLSRGKPRPLLAPLLFASAFLHTFCLPRQAPGYAPLHLLVLSFLLTAVHDFCAQSVW